jgi:recombination protein RecR
MTDSLDRLSTLFQKLPGIGPKSAARLAYHLLILPRSYSYDLARAIENVADNVVNCERCFNYCEGTLCDICLDDERDSSLLCVVEHPKNIPAIEKTGFRGYYHVLGGVISPLEGIGPEQLRIDELLKRIVDTTPQEIIFALNPRIEADTTIDYIKDIITRKYPNINLSKPAAGIPIGSDMEYADAMTLHQAFTNRNRVI